MAPLTLLYCMGPRGIERWPDVVARVTTQETMTSIRGSVIVDMTNAREATELQLSTFRKNIQNELDDIATKGNTELSVCGRQDRKDIAVAIIKKRFFIM